MMMTTISPRQVARLALLPMMMLLALMTMQPPARALEQPPAVKLLLDFLRIELSVQPKVGRITHAENGDIVLHDVVFAEVRKNDRPLLKVQARAITLQAPAVQDGLMHYRQITVDALRFDIATNKAEGNAVIRVPRLLMAQASILPREAATTPQEKLAASQLLASAISIPEVRVELPGVSAFSWRGINGTWEGNRRTGEGRTKLNMGRAQVPLAEILSRPEEVAALRQLGLTTLNLSGMMDSTSTWRADQHLVSSGSLRLAAREAGALSVTLDGLAVPLALIQRGQEMNRALRQQGQPGAGGGLPGQPNRMPGQAFLNDPQFAAAMRTLTLNGFEVRWQDFGLTRRLIAWEAQRRGMTEEEYIADALQRAQAQWGTLLPPALAQRIVRELGHFLQDPKSLRFSFRGVAGQPIQLAGLTMLLFMPQMVMQSVQVEVKANE